MNSNVKKIRISNIKILTRTGLLIALSAIGSMVKIQGTIAFDSMPGYFAALFIDPLIGGIVASVGHILTAITSGFPLTLPMHLITAIVMGFIACIFGFLNKKHNGIIACIVAILLNGPIATFVCAMAAKGLGLPFSGSQMFAALVIPLTAASAANIILAYIIHKIIIKKG